MCLNGRALLRSQMSLRSGLTHKGVPPLLLPPHLPQDGVTPLCAAIKAGVAVTAMAILLVAGADVRAKPTSSQLSIAPCSPSALRTGHCVSISSLGTRPL